MAVRLTRFLASAGFGSRRACEALIKEGKVSINGHFVRNLATTVEADDDVRVAGKGPARVSPPAYILLHKPKGILCTRSDERQRRTVFDLIPSHFGGLHYVGRLDKESEGLVLLTNDGELSHRLTHPGHGVEKEYQVLLNKAFDEQHAARLMRGFRIEGGWAEAERIQIIGPAQVKVVLRQGIKRQIRLMFLKLGYEVKRLQRTRIGSLELGALAPGQWRSLTAHEVALLTGKDKRSP
jgi:23S rRNA pseudouridine2605 synthase